MTGETSHRKLLIVTAGALTALLIAGGVVWLFLPRLGVNPLPPQSRWALRTFDEYRLAYHISGLVDCRVEVEVQGEVPISSQTTPAGGAFCAVMSVTGLFKRIDTLAGGPHCGPNGCGCDGPVTLAVVYDSQLGYPLLIERQLRPDLRWQYFEDWVHELVQGGCTAVGYIGTKIEVTSLTPVP
jgi:hypothetical protein